MKSRVIILLILLIVINSYCFGQGETTELDQYKPFTVLIIKPDGAKIADSLMVWADSIESKHIARYYSPVEGLRSLYEMGTEDMKREAGRRIQEAKLREMEAHDFKYYHTVSDQSLFDLRTLFNTNHRQSNHLLEEPVFQGYTIDRAELFTDDFEKLCRYYKVDYILTFENIHTDTKDKIGILKFVATLFWTKENKMILKRQIEGNASVYNFKFLYQIKGTDRNSFHESGIHCDNYLECMFKSAVRFSTEELYRVISQNQKK
jgi:hypothetical protein